MAVYTKLYNLGEEKLLRERKTGLKISLWETKMDWKFVLAPRVDPEWDQSREIYLSRLIEIIKFNPIYSPDEAIVDNLSKR